MKKPGAADRTGLKSTSGKAYFSTKAFSIT